jgi:xylulokinase
MTAAELVCGIDVGTTAVKVIAVDPTDMSTVSQASGSSGTVATVDGAHEQDAVRLWEQTRRCLRQVTDDVGDRIVGVGLSGHMHSLLLLDGDGAPLAPLATWADRRASKAGVDLTSDPRFLAVAGNDPAEAFTAPKLAWLARTRPDLLDRARTLVSVKDFVGLRLTGVLATDVTDAMGTLLWDVARARWSAELFERCGAPVRLGPPVLDSAALRGRVTVEAAEATGLRPGIPVAAGAGDVSAAVLGSGAARGDLTLSAGTAAQVTGWTPVPDRGSGFLFGSADGSGFVAMASVYAAGASVDWARRVLLDGGDADEAAAGSPPGARGLTYLPMMFGSAVPRRNDRARAALLGQTDAHTRADLVAAVVEGVAFACADAVDVVSAVTGPPRRLMLTGGLSALERWRRTVAAVVGTEVVWVRGGGSPLGAVALGAAAAGIVAAPDEAAGRVRGIPVAAPSADERAALRHARDRYRTWYETLV